MTDGPADPFARLARVYGLLYRDRDVSSLLALLAPRLGDLILDVGGGTGRVAERLADSARGVVVLDPSAPMLQRGRPAPRLPRVRAAAESLPFSDGAFSRIVVVDAFHHFASRPVATRELWRVLAPGGRLVIEEPDIRHRAVRAVAFGEWLLRFGSVFWEPARIAAAFAYLGARTEVIPLPGAAAHVLVEKSGAD